MIVADDWPANFFGRNDRTTANSVAGRSCAEIPSKTTRVVMQYPPKKEHQRLI